LLPSFARADEPSLSDWAKRRVQEGLVKPLAESEGHTSRFSRARPVPRERRVRVTQTAASTDKVGRKFVTFAVDVRFGSSAWRENDIVGCAYVGAGELFIKSGDAFFPSALLLGKKVEAAAGACQPAPTARS
jgi:hypothetical protein